VHGLNLPFRHYQVEDASGTLQVYYCLWSDLATEQGFERMSLTYRNRLEPVLNGRRNSGQRSLEVVVWGIADEGAAEERLVRELERVIRVEDGSEVDHGRSRGDEALRAVRRWSVASDQ
jgi:hypothetical protein